MVVLIDGGKTALLLTEAVVLAGAFAVAYVLGMALFGHVGNVVTDALIKWWKEIA